MRLGTRLRETSRELRAPPRARLRFLEELRADLEDLQATLRASGFPAAEARRRAEAMLVPDAETLAALSCVHRPLWVRWQEGAPVRGGRVVGGVLGVVVVAGAAAVVREAASLRDVPLFVVPLAGIALAAGVHAVAKAARIWVAGESQATRVSADSSDLLVAAAGASVATVLGILLELYSTAMRIELQPALQLDLIAQWLRRSVILGAAGIAVALVCSIAWLFFVRHAAGLSRRERVLFGPDMDLVTSVPRRRS